MALIVEDGTNVAGANSFVTRAAIIAYAASRGVALLDDETTDVIGVKACDFIVAQPCYKGEIAYVTQPLPFPRKGLIDGDEADDWVYTIPEGVKRCQLQLCVDIANGIDVMPSRGADVQKLKRRKVGPIEREFFEGDPNTDAIPFLPIASAAIRPYQCGNGGFSVRTYRV